MGSFSHLYLSKKYFTTLRPMYSFLLKMLIYFFLLYSYCVQMGWVTQSRV